MIRSTPYAAGLTAGQAGQSALGCPHPIGSVERRAWLRGHTAGLQAFRSGRVHGGKLVGLDIVKGFQRATKSIGRY